MPIVRQISYMVEYLYIDASPVTGGFAMKTKRLNNLVAMIVAVLMVFAMMPMTAGSVFAEADPDITPPVMEYSSLERILPDGKDKVTVGDKVTLAAVATDDREMGYVRFDLYSPVTHSRQNLNAAYDSESGKWLLEKEITDETENGIWMIESVVASDKAGNYVSYTNRKVWNYATDDLSMLEYEVISPDCPLDLNTDGYSIVIDGVGATTTFGGVYYVNEPSDTVTPTVKVRFDADDGTWNTLAPRKYTLKYEKKSSNGSWEDYTADTFGVDEDGTATYRVSAIGKESLFYTGTVGPVEFNVIKKHKVTFDTRGGNIIDPQYVIPGEKATEPADPTKEGWHFNEWFTDEGLTEYYWFGKPVTEDITLHASWYTGMALGIYNDSNPKIYQCGTVDIEASKQEGCYSDAATMNFTAPEGTIKFTAKPAEGYKFKGWYKGIVGSSYYVETPSDELLSEDIEYTCEAGELAICAVFEGVDVTMSVGVYDQTNSACGQGGSYTFNDEDTTHTADRHIVPNGSEVHLIAVPAAGYEFAGWCRGKTVEGSDQLAIEPVGEAGTADPSGKFNAEDGLILCAVFRKNEGTNPTPTPKPETDPSPASTAVASAVKVGGECSYGGQKYVVTALPAGGAQGEVAFKAAKNAKKVTVPAAIKLTDGKTYNVTSVNTKAFKGTKIRTVTIGKNVKKIKKNAFKGSKTTKMIVKTKLLKKASVKGSLKGSKIRTVQVKVGNKSKNKKYIKKYKKIFTKENAGKKAAIK